MAQKGAAELIFRGRREQKAAFPPWFDACFQGGDPPFCSAPLRKKESKNKPRWFRATKTPNPPKRVLDNQATGRGD